MGEHLVCDTETDNLLDAVTKLHMIQVGTLDGEDVTIYADGLDYAEIERARGGVMVGGTELTLTCPIRPLSEGIARLRAADVLYFHNGIGYDQVISDRFLEGVVTRGKLWDTLIMARLLTRELQNSLEAWGRRLGVHKGDFNGPWDRCTAEMLAYSQQDIPAGRALTRHLLALAPGAERALATEHAVAYWMRRQEETGFTLDEVGCRDLHIELQAKLRGLETKLRVAFPPRWTNAGLVIPKASNGPRGVTKGVPYTRVLWEEFSPASRQAIAGRLQEAGWKPREFTPGGAPTVDEETLMALAGKFPAAALLADYFDTGKQAAFVGSWLGFARKGKVHGRINTLGAYTQRMSHSKPNMAQIPKAGPYRALWLPRKGWVLVGVDGEGIQARVMAHYLAGWDGGRYGDIIVNGSKDAGPPTDIHSLNAQAISKLFPEAMGTKARRDTAKNLNYAIYFGAQDARLGQTIKDGCISYAKLAPPKVPNRELGAAARRGLETNMNGLSALSALVETTFEKRKFLKGADGRKLFPPNKRNALVTLIQAGEAVIMKTSLVIFCDETVPAKGWVYDLDFALVANVHDEVQIETRPEIADAVGKAFADAITEAGTRLGLKCPQAGSVSIGKNWHETH